MTPKYFAGVDSGSTYCKCVIVDDASDEIRGKGIERVEADVRATAKSAMEHALAEAGVKKAKRLKQIVVTGRNQKKVPFKKTDFPTMTCVGKGAFTMNPAVRTIIDVGGFTNKAVKLSDSGKVMEYVVNDRCASGSGYFLELVAKALETDVDHLGKMGLESSKPVSVTAQCSIFAESEVIYLINEGEEDTDVVAGVSRSIANRCFSILKRVKMEREIALTGGVANSESIRKFLEVRLGHETTTFPIDPIYMSAYGGALIARDHV